MAKPQNILVTRRYLSFSFLTDVHAIICQTKRPQIADGRYVLYSCLINIVILGLIKLDQLTICKKRDLHRSTQQQT